MPDGVRPPTTGTGFIYDRRDLMQETDGFGGDVDLMYAGATDEIYGDLISEGDGDGLIHFYDAMGSTVALADGSSGDVLDRYKYTAFGQLYAADIDGGGWAAPSGDPASATLAFGKKRYYADSENALFLLGAGGGKDDRGGNVSLAGRYYDPVVGRFVSDDPGRQSGGDINMQRYVGNDPVNKLDPSGQDDDYNPFKWAWHHRQGAFYYAERAAGIDPATANEGAKEFKAESQAVKNTAFMVAGMAIEGITESEKALFEDALKFAGKTAEELVSAIKPFTEEVVTTVRTLIKHSDLIWASVKTGMFAGLTEFMGVDLSDDKISLGTKAEKVAEKLGDELGNLFGVSDLAGLLKQFFAGGKNVEEVAAEIGLKLVGYDWDSILGVVSEELGPFGSMAIGFVTALVGEVADQGGVWAGIKHMVADGEKAAASAMTNAVGELEKLPGQLLAKGVQRVAEEVPEAIGKGVAKLATELGIPVGGWVALLAEGVELLYKNRDTIRGLYNAADTGFHAAINAAKDLDAGRKIPGLVKDVATLTNKELEAAAGVILNGLMSFAGLGNLPDAISDGLDELRDIAQTPLRMLMSGLAAPVKKLLAEFSGDKTSTPTGEASHGGDGDDAATHAPEDIKESSPPILDDNHITLLWAKREGHLLLVKASGSETQDYPAQPEGSALDKAEQELQASLKALKPAAEAAKARRDEWKNLKAKGGDKAGIKEAKKAARDARKSAAVLARDVKAKTRPYAKELKTVVATAERDLWKVGAYKDLKTLNPTYLRAHHVGQKALMKKFVSGYDEETAPSILVPKIGHSVRDESLDVGAQIVSRSMKGLSNATEVVQRDIDELKRVYPAIPEPQMRALVEMNQRMYSGIGKIKI